MSPSVRTMAAAKRRAEGGEGPIDPIPLNADKHQKEIDEIIPPAPTEEYFEGVLERQRVEADVRNEETELETRKRMVTFGVPVKDVEAIAVKGLEDSIAMQHAREFEGAKQYILILSGPAGSGKTTAAANWLVRAGPILAAAKFGLKLHPPMFITATRLFRASRYDTDLMDTIEKARKLVVDDIGTEYSDQKGFVTSFVDGLFNSRYEHLLPTVFTTNLRVDDFKARYGERVARRIRRVGKFVSIEVAPYAGIGGQDG